MTDIIVNQNNDYTYDFIFEDNQTQLIINMMNIHNHQIYQCIIHNNDLLNKNYYIIKNVSILHYSIMKGITSNDSNIYLKMNILDGYIILNLNLLNDAITLQLNLLNNDKIEMYKLKIKILQKQYYDNIEYIKKNKSCQQIHYEKNKKYNDLNKDKRKESRKKYRELNKDKQKQWSKTYYEKNKDKFRQWNKTYYEQNREKFKEYNKKYYEQHKPAKQNRSIQNKIRYDENKNKIYKCLECNEEMKLFAKYRHKCYLINKTSNIEED